MNNAPVPFPAAVFAADLHRSAFLSLAISFFFSTSICLFGVICKIYSRQQSRQGRNTGGREVTEVCGHPNIAQIWQTVLIKRLSTTHGAFRLQTRGGEDLWMIHSQPTNIHAC